MQLPTISSTLPTTSGALVVLGYVVTTGSQATVDFSGIPSGYSALSVIWSAQATAAGTGLSSVFLKINGDATAANYTDCGRIGAQNASAFASISVSTTGGGYLGAVTNSGNTSFTGTGELLIPGYSDTTWHKRVTYTNAVDNPALAQTLMLAEFRWKSTAAINQLTFSTDGTAFTNGSIFLLCGIANRSTQALTVGPMVPQARLTTESGVPVSTSDRTSQSTLYWTPYNGNRVRLFTNGAWTEYILNEKSLALSALTSGKNYDVFAYDSGGQPTLELSTAWTNDTTRASALATQDSVYVKSGDASRLWLGTIRTTSTTTTEDSGGGVTTQVGGKRYVWNAYNQVRRELSVFDSTDNWVYTTASWRVADNAAANKVEYVTGIVSTNVEAHVTAGVFLDGSTSGASVGVGIDSTTVRSGYGSQVTSGTGNRTYNISARYLGIPGLGYHAINWIEYGASGTNCVFIGDNGGTTFGANQQAGLTATIWN